MSDKDDENLISFGNFDSFIYHSMLSSRMTFLQAWKRLRLAPYFVKEWEAASYRSRVLWIREQVRRFRSEKQHEALLAKRKGEKDRMAGELMAIAI